MKTIDKIKETYKLFSFWIQKYDGYGIKKALLYDCYLSKRRVDLILRNLRKIGQVTYKRKRWYLSQKKIEELKRRLSLK